MSKAPVDYSRYQCLKIEKEGKLAIVTLNQPETGNRIAHRFHVELQDIWADLARDREVNAILMDKANARRIEDQGAEVETGSPEQLQALVKSEVARWKGVIASAKITAD